MSMFEIATRKRLRFPSPKGQLTVEDLWSLPLQSRTSAANLDDIAKDLARSLKASAETVSYVSPAVGGADADLQISFDIVKHIIDVRVAERDKAADAAKRKETKDRILEIIAAKQDESLRGKSIEELMALANSL